MVNETQLVNTERELQRLIARKQASEQHIATLEARLYDLETEYLYETTTGHGSVLKSLDGYHGLKNNNTNSNNIHNVKRSFTDQDRIFSRSSSASYKHSVRLYRAATGHLQNDDNEDIEGDLSNLMMAGGGNSDDELFTNNDDNSGISSSGGSPKRKKNIINGSHKKKSRK